MRKFWPKKKLLTKTCVRQSQHWLQRTLPNADPQQRRCPRCNRCERGAIAWYRWMKTGWRKDKTMKRKQREERMRGERKLGREGGREGCKVVCIEICMETPMHASFRHDSESFQPATPRPRSPVFKDRATTVEAAAHPRLMMFRRVRPSADLFSSSASSESIGISTPTWRKTLNLMKDSSMSRRYDV